MTRTSDCQDVFSCITVAFSLTVQKGAVLPYTNLFSRAWSPNCSIMRFTHDYLLPCNMHRNDMLQKSLCLFLSCCMLLTGFSNAFLIREESWREVPYCDKPHIRQFADSFTRIRTLWVKTWQHNIACAVNGTEQSQPGVRLSVLMGQQVGSTPLTFGGPKE